jgi:hypothetical protein
MGLHFVSKLQKKKGILKFASQLSLAMDRKNVHLP